MYADEDYQRRITYGTPENIKIRRFYNQLNNRPLNYGMGDLFPETPINTMTPLPYNQNAGSYSVPASNRTIDWPRLGKAFYDEFSNDAQLVRLGGENYLNAVSQGEYQWLNGVLGGNYAERKQDYYNILPNDNWRNAAQIIDSALEKYAQATFPYQRVKQGIVNGAQKVAPYIKKYFTF